MEKPLPFVLEKDGQFELNEDLLKIIEKSNNPRLLLFYGETRQGKSTTLNQIIRGNIDTWKFINKSPFESKTCQERVTIGCNIFGPIKCSDIIKRHQLDNIIKEDFDIFFCDTEGLFSLNGQSKELIPGILTLLQICNFSVIMTKSVPDLFMISQISSEIQFSKILQQINDELKSPLVSIYVSGYMIDITEINNFEECLNMYEKEGNKSKDLILKKINEDNPNLHVSNEDLKVIPGGPFLQNFNKEPNHDDLCPKLYWNSINNIAKEFIIHCTKSPSYSAGKLISLMKIVFDIFKNFRELPKEADLSNVLIKYINDSFNEYSNKQIEIIIKNVKNDLKNKYEEYYKMLTDDDEAQNKLNNCLKKDMIEIYKNFIPDKIKNFMERALLKFRNEIENQFENEFEIKSKEIVSDDYIDKYIINITNEINKAYFQEDIDMNIVEEYKNIWNLIDEENEKLFSYFKERKSINIKILKNNFNYILENKINNLICKKKNWKSFFEEKKEIILKEISSQYSESFRKIQYQEDFNKIIKPINILSKELFEKYNEKFFKNIPNDKKKKINNWIKKECKSEYNKIKEYNKTNPKWEDIIENIKFIIKDILNNYIKDIFNRKYFKNEVNFALGKKETFLNKIPKELITYPEAAKDKQEEIINIINDEVNRAVALFNKKRDNLPSFDQVLLIKEKLCNKIANEKIKKLMSKFNYEEDKIHFDTDNFYSLLRQNEKINLGMPQNNIKFDNMIRKVSQNKSNEYNNILVPQLPKWSEIKEYLKMKIDNKCKEFISNIMKNKYFKEDVKYDIDELDIYIVSLNLFDEISPNKNNEIIDLIDEIKENTKKKIKNKINNLTKWSNQKELLVQSGYLIMNDRLKSHLNTKNLNEIINILVDEVLNTPNILDSCKDEKKTNEFINEIQIKAEQIAKSYIKNKNEEERKFRENQKLLEQQKQEQERLLRLQIEQYERKQKEIERKIIEEKQRAERERESRERAEKEVMKALERIEKEERVARESRERAEREIRQRAEREARERAEREARQRAEREARERAEREARERAEREARQRAEREARERAEREARERAEREARERAEREARARQFFPRTPYGGCSIVDGLKAIGVDSSYGYRAQIAARNGIGGYRGAPNQNTHMLNLLKRGELLRP